MSRIIAVTVAAFAFVSSGCSSNSEAPRGDFSPRTMAASALTLYDVNKDGKIDASELKKCAALASSLAAIDTNNDKSIDESELSQRFEFYTTSGTTVRGIAVLVTRGAAPAGDVDVTFEPEAFMGGAVKPATGKTNASGIANLTTEGLDFPGVQIGMYRALVSKKDASGKETLPTKFNTETNYGWEVSPGDRVDIKIDLKR